MVSFGLTEKWDVVVMYLLIFVFCVYPFFSFSFPHFCIIWTLAFLAFFIIGFYHYYYFIYQFIVMGYAWI